MGVCRPCCVGFSRSTGEGKENEVRAVFGIEVWKPEVNSRYYDLVERADSYERSGGGPSAEIKNARDALHRADCLRTRTETFGQWWSGSLVDEVWRELHDAEEHLALAAPDNMVAEAVRMAEAHIAKASDEDGVNAKALRDAHTKRDLRSSAASTLDECHAITDVMHQAARRNRNLSVATSGVLFLAAAVVLLVEGLTSGSVLFDPTGAMSASVLLALVFVFGAVGGLIGALAFQGKDPSLKASTDQFKAVGSVLAMKTATGLWIGLLGVWLTASGVLGFDYNSIALAFAIAFAFGFTQEQVTRWLPTWVASKMPGAKEPSAKDDAAPGRSPRRHAPLVS